MRPAATLQTRAGWALCGVAVLLAGVHTWVFLGWAETRVHPTGWPELTVAALLGAVLGAVIVARRPGHLIGWLFIVGGVLLLLDNLLISFDAIVTAGPHPDPPALWPWAVWVSAVIDTPQPVLFIILLFLLFPDGRLPSRRWRPVLWASIASAVLFVVVLAVTTPPWQVSLGNHDRLGGATGGALLGVLVLTLVLELLAAAASVVLRLRRAVGLERQQLRWLAVFAATVAIGFVMSASLPWQEGLLGWVRIMPLHLGFGGVVVGAALAVLRYRLYDFDVVVSRAIVLTAMTALVASGYVVLVVALGGALGPAVDQAFWPSLAATVLVALAVQPLRSRLLRVADRVVFGTRAAPYEALAELGRSLARAPGATDLLQHVAAAVGEASGARQVTAVLEVPDGATLRASWPADAEGHGDGERTVLPVLDRGERLGEVVLVMPPGRPLRATEHTLVAALLDQTALALRNLRLETELAGQVAELDRRTTDLQASRRRLLVAGDEEKARLTADLGRRVLPHLQPLPGGLSALAGERDTSRVVERLVEGQAATTTALDELRRLVRRLGPGVRPGASAQETADIQAAASRSGPNADLVT